MADGDILDLSSRERRLLTYYLLAIPITIAVFTVVYDWGMAHFENRQKTMVQSLQVVVESITTTGYGEDAAWSSVEMNLLAIAMQATGVIFLFTALPVIALPLIRAALETRPPTSLDPVEDHVVICAYDVHTEALVDECDAWDLEYVILENDREQAAELYENGYEVVHGDPESVADLEDVHVGDARAAIVEAGDEVNASIILAIKSSAPDTRVVSVTETEKREPYHRLAGADEVFSPRDQVGERLAQKATTTVTSELEEAVEVGEDFEIAELAIHSGAELVGTLLWESGIRERTGANVIGAWVDGEFQTPTDLTEPLNEHTVLLVVGTEEQVEALNELTLSAARRHAPGKAIVAGHGETGRGAVTVLAEAGIEHTVLDIVGDPSVDVVGDATDPDALREAGIETTSTIILTLESDVDTIFATLVARDLSPDVEIIARANDRESVRKIYRAGADYVLSLSRVTGRLLASTVLDEDLLAYDTQVKVVRLSAGRLAGQTLASADVRQETGCTVIAVERDGSVRTGLDPDFRIERDDELVVAGTDEGIASFRDLTG